MNIQTGDVLSGAALVQAQERGDPLVQISPEAAARIRAGYAAKERETRRRNRKRNSVASDSRKRNRRNRA